MDGLTVDKSSQATIVATSDSTVDVRLVADTSLTEGSIRTSGTTPNLGFYVGGTKYANISDGGDISFYEDTGTTPKLFWDASAESLGIGTTTPARLVDLKDSSNVDGARLRLRSAIGIDTVPTIGSVEFYSEDNSTNSSGIVGSIDVEGIGTWNGASNNAAMTFNLIQGLAGTTSPIEAMRIDSAGNVGIGTSSVSALLHLRDGSTEDVSGSKIRMDLSGTNPYWEVQARNGGSAANRQLGFYTSATSGDVLTLTQAGNVGIGTSSPSAKCLELQPPAQITDFSSNILNIGGQEADDAVGTKSGIGFGYTSTSIPAAPATIGFETINTSGGTYGDLYFATRATTGTEQPTERMRIDSAGNIRLTGTAPNSEDNISTINFFNSSSGINLASITGKRTAGGTNYGSLIFNTTSSGTAAERMRIDSSGNLLVGTTVANPAGSNSVGVGISSGSYGGFIGVTRDGNTPVEINRKTSDGNLITLRKDGTSVGSIGSAYNEMYIGSGATGLYFNDTSKIIHTIDTVTLSGSSTDGTVDLGYSGTRFKDLYLSGGVYLGGTGAANKLDDYEEGTWTPTLTTSNGGTVGLQYAKGRYTKVGNLVHVSVNIRRDATALSGTDGFLRISAPFTSASSEASHRAGASCVYQTVTLNGILVARMQANMPYFNLQKETNGVLNTSITAADLSNGAPASSSGYVQVAFSYLSV
jgi:hypothetical protein